MLSQYVGTRRQPFGGLGCGQVPKTPQKKHSDHFKRIVVLVMSSCFNNEQLSDTSEVTGWDALRHRVRALKSQDESSEVTGSEIWHHRVRALRSQGQSYEVSVRALRSQGQRSDITRSESIPMKSQGQSHQIAFENHAEHHMVLLVIA